MPLSSESFKVLSRAKLGDVIIFACSVQAMKSVVLGVRRRGHALILSRPSVELTHVPFFYPNGKPVAWKVDLTDTFVSVQNQNKFPLRESESTLIDLVPLSCGCATHKHTIERILRAYKQDPKALRAFR